MALAYMFAGFPSFATGVLYAAYRPVVVQVYDDLPLFGTPAAIPVVFLDVYINGAYYKSLSSTSPVLTLIGGGNKRLWTFDLQDTLQEYLRSEPATLSAATIDSAPASICTFYTKARGSSINTAGLTVVDGAIPVQGNFDTAPVAGGGLQSNTWIAANSALQHEERLTLQPHLVALKHALAVSTAVNVLPLTHRPTDGSYATCGNQYDHFPVLLPWNSISGGNGATSFTMIVDWKERGGGTFSRNLGTFPIAGAPAIYNIPVGMGNLMPLLSSGPSAPDLNKLTEYLVYLRDDSAAIAWTSGWIKAAGCGSCGARLHFLNALGGYDAVNFTERQETLITSSARYQKGLPLTGHQRRDYGHQRFGVRSNEKVVLRSNLYPEEAGPWLKELLDSPRVYLETLSAGDTVADLVPVVIQDGEFIIRKVDDRFEYVLELAYQPSNENIRQRG